MDEHKKKLWIPDTYWHDEVDGTGTVVAKYVVKDSTSIYPPNGRSITCEKVG